VTSATKVAVLGKTVNDTLFGPDVDSTGQIIRVRNQPFKVIGVMSAKGKAAWDPTWTIRSWCPTRRS